MGIVAPVGNQNAKKAKIWEQAIRRALARYTNGTTDLGLDKLADQLVAFAAKGESWALLEVGNRLDGKPAQAVTVAGDEDGGPVQHALEVRFVEPG